MIMDVVGQEFGQHTEEMAVPWCLGPQLGRTRGWRRLSSAGDGNLPETPLTPGTWAGASGSSGCWPTWACHTRPLRVAWLPHSVAASERSHFVRAHSGLHHRCSSKQGRGCIFCDPAEVTQPCPWPPIETLTSPARIKDRGCRPHLSVGRVSKNLGATPNIQSKRGSY